MKFYFIGFSSKTFIHSISIQHFEDGLILGSSHVGVSIHLDMFYSSIFVFIILITDINISNLLKEVDFLDVNFNLNTRVLLHSHDMAT